MKKLLPALVLLSLLAVLLFPSLVSAQVVEKCKLKRDFTYVDTSCTKGAEVEIEKYGMCCLLNSIYGITDWLFLVLVALATVFVIIGAMQILTAGGDPTKVSTGRGYIIYAMVGLLLAFLAKAVPGIVKMIMGV